MTEKEFRDLVDNRIKEVKNILGLKSAEYSDGVDKLHNFKEGARVDNITPEEALWGMYLKHFLSVRKMVKDGRPVSKELLAEKMNDSIAYHLLLEAILTEKQQTK